MGDIIHGLRLVGGPLHSSKHNLVASYALHTLAVSLLFRHAQPSLCMHMHMRTCKHARTLSHSHSQGHMHMLAYMCMRTFSHSSSHRAHTRTQCTGAVDIAILAQHYKTEIVVFDTQTLRIDRFGQDGNYRQRVLLIYDGIHYDALALGIPGECVCVCACSHASLCACVRVCVCMWR